MVDWDTLLEKQLLLEWFIRELTKPGGKKRFFAAVGSEEHASVVALKKLSEEELIAATP